MNAEPQTDSRGRRGYVGRAGRSLGQLWQVPMFFIGLVSFGLTFITAPSRGDPAATEFQAELTRLRQGLQPDREKPAILVAQAENLLARLSQFHRHAGETQFLAGSAYFRQAQACAVESLAANQKKAVAHLEEALALGVSANDQPPLRFRLGLMLFQQGKDHKRAVELMAQSVEKAPTTLHAATAPWWMRIWRSPSPISMRPSPPTKSNWRLSTSAVPRTWPKPASCAANCFFAKSSAWKCSRNSSGSAKGAPQPVRVKARLLQARICTEEGLWNRAIPVWKELLKDAAAIDGGKARALYELGLAYKSSTPPQNDEAATQWEQAFALGGGDGQAAGIRLGEIKLLYGPKADAPGALAIWSKALADIHTANDYKIQALELKRARAILENACIYFLDNHDYERTRQVAELYKRIAQPGLAEERIAQAAEGLARAAMDKATRLGTADDSDKMQEVRAEFHRAAVAYEEAAVARVEGTALIYWRSAQCYLAAQDFARAGAVLGKFVSLEKNETRLAEGYLALAEVFARLGNKTSAREFYYKCIQFPGTPFESRARYQLALEEIDKKNYEEAKGILKQNVVRQVPVLDRKAHEQSIYKLAELNYLMHDFVTAAIYFKQAIEQYPNHADLCDARALFADCYCKLAELSQKKFLDAKDDGTKAHHQNDRQSWLAQAAGVYDALADELEHKARQTPLVPKELGLLREALFTAAELKFNMNEFPEALRRYEVIQDKYRKKAEGLIACQKIWHCVAVLIDSPSQARMAVAAITDGAQKVQDRSRNHARGKRRFPWARSL